MLELLAPAGSMEAVTAAVLLDLLLEGHHGTF